MNGPDTDALGESKMAVECVAHIAVAATWLQDAPFGPLVHYNPGELAIHVVNNAMKRGHLGFLHTALTRHLK